METENEGAARRRVGASGALTRQRPGSKPTNAQQADAEYRPQPAPTLGENALAGALEVAGAGFQPFNITVVELLRGPPRLLPRAAWLQIVGEALRHRDFHQMNFRGSDR